VNRTIKDLSYTDDVERLDAELTAVAAILKTSAMRSGLDQTAPAGRRGLSRNGRSRDRQSLRTFDRLKLARSEGRDAFKTAPRPPQFFLNPTK